MEGHIIGPQQPKGATLLLGYLCGMQILVKGFAIAPSLGWPLKVGAEDSVSNLKKKILQQLRVRAPGRLLFGGKQLMDSLFIRDYGIADGSVVEFQTRTDTEFDGSSADWRIRKQPRLGCRFHRVGGDVQEKDFCQDRPLPPVPVFAIGKPDSSGRP